MNLTAAPLVFLAGLSVAACTRQTPLAYAPTTPVTNLQAPAIGRINTTDQRGESDPTWIGAVRGGFGNPLKVLHTPQPLADMVTAAFHDALAARGLLAANGAGQADLDVTIPEFNSTQYIRREANVTLVVELRDHATGQLIYRDQVRSSPVQGSVLALDVGIFGSSDDLQAVAQGAMNQAIDAALDKPGFVSALRSTNAPAA